MVPLLVQKRNNEGAKIKRRWEAVNIKGCHVKLILQESKKKLLKTSCAITHYQAFKV